jgi:endonuclease/exonuclease/phosphatase family metal-dependent hydrolase
LVSSAEEAMPTLRVVSFNIKGARVPGRKSRSTQERSWHLLAAFGADVALMQEVEHEAIPQWARERWSLVVGDVALVGGPDMGWGSVIAARPKLQMRPRTDVLEDRVVRLLYDYAVFGEIVLPGGESALVASVHAPAVRVPDYLKCVRKAGALSDEEMRGMAQPGDDAWALDLFFAAMKPLVEGRRFVIGGDWNNSRLFDEDRKPGELPFATMFFTRARAAGWVDCHSGKNEERSYLGGKRPHQLDHVFCDSKTAEAVTECSVRLDWVTPELSDHAAVVTDLRWQ